MSHLRHCARHSRPGRPMPLPCAHCALAAKPAPVAVAVMEPEPAAPVPTPVETIQKKRGPKPKFGVAMTPAERKTRSRTNQKAKLDDAERRKLVAEILVIARRNLAGPDKPGRERITVKRRNDIRDENRNFLRIL